MNHHTAEDSKVESRKMIALSTFLKLTVPVVTDRFTLIFDKNYYYNMYEGEEDLNLMSFSQRFGSQTGYLKLSHMRAPGPRSNFMTTR